ncbi:LAMI_0F13674g1_1 [Lachancea mirantina]|uniref:COP9 signalosome complex subunit 5 n=1 Tax=Lachancea mirantina TaxID=1230905 RepID=A0A1G4K3R5_9SACH|nr:LAMI_0F13674g1_1 [Lachancea mirantina]
MYQDKSVQELTEIIDDLTRSINLLESIGHYGAPSLQEELVSSSNLTDLLVKTQETSNNNPTRPSSGAPLSKVLLSTSVCHKMLQHAGNGGDIEVMGMLIGRVFHNSFVVFDCFSLPVEGTETRVNAQSESYEYMVSYVDELYGKDSKKWKVVGWYHSHPGYDCWLSNIDIETQRLNQKFQDPYVALVIDPKKSTQNGKLALGAFRTIDEKTDGGESAASNLALYSNTNHDSAMQYYELEISAFDSQLDAPLNNFSAKSTAPLETTSDEGLFLLEQLLEIVKSSQNFDNMRRTGPWEIPNIINTGEMASERLNDAEAARAAEDSAEDIFELKVCNSADSDSDVEMGSNTAGDTTAERSSISTDMVEQNAGETVNAGNTLSLQNEFLLRRKRLQRFKLQEYRDLRFFRDSFLI